MGKKYFGVVHYLELKNKPKQSCFQIKLANKSSSKTKYFKPYKVENTHPTRLEIQNGEVSMV
jgi:hypothetical protein